MEIRQLFLDDIDEISQIAYEHLKNEASYVPALRISGIEEIRQYLKKSAEKLNGVVGIEHGKVVGYLLYKKTDEKEKIKCCYFPIVGYGAITKNREKIMTMLFQYLADILVIDQRVHFEINVYAHDAEIIQLFSFMQFGIQCENCLRNMDEIVAKTDIVIKEMSKIELKHRWQEVWFLLSNLIEHLKQSPVFYPCDEFTEDVYKEFFLDEDTRVFVAEKEGVLVGVMETNNGSNSIITSSKDCYNVGDIYVLNEYRGKNIAQALLSYANNCLKEIGCNLQWVEHGTANPNARGFWNKYFSTYAYTLIRDIDPIIRG